VVRPAAPRRADDARVRQLARETFVLGFPLLVMDLVRRAHPLTQSGFRRFPPAAHKVIPGLFHDDPHCLHTSAFADLATAPAVLRLPNTYGRYLSVTLFDSAGEPFAALGSRTGHSVGGEILLAGPEWRDQPADPAPHVRAPSDSIWAISRILARSEADRGVTEALAKRQRLIQRGVDVRSTQGAPPGDDEAAALELAPLSQIAATPPQLLLHRLTVLLERAPRPFQREWGEALGRRLAQLAAETDRTGAERTTEPMRRGFADGWKDIQTSGREEGARAAGDWRPVPAFDEADAAAPAAPAVRVLASLGAPLREDILSLRCFADEAGRPLNGAEQYRILLLGSALPPSLAGWRLTAHNGPDRPGEVIGDDGRLVMGCEDALELSLQREPPPGGPNGNWLLTPPGPFELTLRLYFPTQAALSGAWRMAPVERLGSRLDGRPREREPPPPAPPPPSPRDCGPQTISAC
jgi:hypothetical protein